MVYYFLYSVLPAVVAILLLHISSMNDPFPSLKSPLDPIPQIAAAGFRPLPFVGDGGNGSKSGKWEAPSWLPNTLASRSLRYGTAILCKKATGSGILLRRGVFCGEEGVRGMSEPVGRAIS